MHISKNKFRDAIHRYKGLGLAAAITMVVVGILLFIFPMISAFVWTIALVIGLIAQGVINIIRFATAKPGHRPGWLLANGIISLVIAISAVVAIPLNHLFEDQSLQDAINSTTQSVMFWTLIYLGWFCLFKGIFRLVSVKYRVKAGASKGYEIASSILSIVLGAFITIFPFWSNETLNIITIYLVGVAMIFRGVTMFFDMIFAPDVAKVINDDVFKEKHSSMKNVETVDAKPIEDENNNNDQQKDA